MLDEQAVQLEGNLLVIVICGRLILQRDDQTRVVNDGDACLVSSGQFSVTEAPHSGMDNVEIVYVFFDDRALRRRFPQDLARVEQIALTVTPAFTGLYPLPNFLPSLTSVLRSANLTFPYNLSPVLRYVFGHGWAAAFMFLKPFFARRRALHVYLEKHVFPVAPGKTVMDAYPGGRRQFGRDYRAQYDVPVERWLTWRRLEVARWKIRYENSMSVEQIAAASGYRNFHRFRHQFRRRFRLWPEEIRRKKSREELSLQDLAPFWHWSYPESLYIREAAMASLARSYNAQYPRRERRRLKREDLIWSGHVEDEPPAEHGILSSPAEPAAEAPANVKTVRVFRVRGIPRTRSIA